MIENNCDKLSMKIKNATKVIAESTEISKAVMLLMCQCQPVEHGNNGDFLWRMVPVVAAISIGIWTFCEFNGRLL